MEKPVLIELTAEIVSNYVANNNVAADELPSVIEKIHAAVSSLGEAEQAPEEKMPVVSVRASVKPDYIVCLECGKRQKVLRRHLQIGHGMTPEEYRKDYGLPGSYPMVAPNYSERRRALAKQVGFGRKKGPAPVKKSAPGKRPAKSQTGAGE
jgi:predicted transcriptional regulator